MTVSDLIAELENFDEDAEVYFAYDYGDHCHSLVAQEANELTERLIKWSSYHKLYRVADDDETDDDNYGEAKFKPLTHPSKNAVVIQ